VPAWTLRFTPVPDDAERGTVEAAALRASARVRWQRPRYGRQYALIEAADGAIIEAPRATRFSGPVIALAVCPSMPEALPGLYDALGGAGRPAGVAGCDRVGDAVIVEWDLDRTPYETIEALIDTECGIYRSGRVHDLIAPLPVAWLARLAAYGLRASEIAPDRVLEVQLEAQGLDA
jgi:hypothetical protein